VEVELLLLADSAQVVGEKLYMLGGGWRVLHTLQFPVVHPMGIALGILVDWQETNRRHQFKLDLEHEDSGGQNLVSIEGEFETGRPPGTPAGMEQQVIMAFNVQAKFEKPGQYIARVMLNGQNSRRLPFTVMLNSPHGLPPTPSA
jgi:hypothetical protein